MALCVSFQLSGGSTTPPAGTTWPAGDRIGFWTVGDASFVDGQYTCPSATHLVMTVAEVNARAASVPDPQVMRDGFFMSFGLILSVYLVGKCVGAVLRLIRGEESEFN